MTCGRCAQEEKKWQIAPPCRAGQTCELPELLPANLPAWEFYLSAATQFCMDFHVDVIRLMETAGIRRPDKMIRKLNLIYAEARANQERTRGK